jgi:hypothetical protein
MTAIKPIYNRKTKAYDITVVEDANPLYAHEGYLVFDDRHRVLAAVQEGKLLQGWPYAKIKACIDWLLGGMGS